MTRMNLVLGNTNTAVGAVALFNNVDGSENTAVGNEAGQNVITGFNNTYVAASLVPSPTTKAIPSASATSRTGTGPGPYSATSVYLQ